MVTKKPLFHGDSEIDQLFRIFRFVLQNLFHPVKFTWCEQRFIRCLRWPTLKGHGIKDWPPTWLPKVRKWSGKKFIKVRGFHFKSGKSEMLRVHINLFLSPLNNKLMLGYKKINRICTLLSSNSWTCWNALCNTYPIKWWICEFHWLKLWNKEIQLEPEGKWKTVEFVGKIWVIGLNLSEILIKGKENLFQLAGNSSNPSLSHRGSTVTAKKIIRG